jgi:F1F0 ATPase subunit 2
MNGSMEPGPLLAVAALWGLALGAAYFGGLWWTVRSLPRWSRPRTWLAMSFAARVSLALGGFWLALEHGLPALVTTVAAFFGVRLVMTRAMRNKKRTNAGDRP